MRSPERRRRSSQTACFVEILGATGTHAQVRITRNGRVYATASADVRGRLIALRPPTVHRLRPGRYTLRVRLTRAGRAPTTLVRAITIRR